MKQKLNKQSLLKLFSYLIVGGGATVVEWAGFWFFHEFCGIQYLAATVIAIVISTFSNWLFGRLLTFRDAQKGNILLEIAKIYAVSIVGLLMNLGLMWLMVEQLAIWEMAAKMIATAIVFAYNYLVRVLFVYRRGSYD